MTLPTLFARITKYDAIRGVVQGRMVQEVIDHSGEIFDYAKSKPHFQAWSDGFKRDTDGKSLGNVRAMHGKVSAGKLTGIDFLDSEKAIDIEAKIIDPVEKTKLAEGLYTGFSIGGRYDGDPWEDPDHPGVRRYAAIPSEVSLVDAPCVPTARFTLVKGDGLSEERPFVGALKKEILRQGWSGGRTGAFFETKELAAKDVADTVEKLLKGERIEGADELAKSLGIEMPAPAAKDVVLGAGDRFTRKTVLELLKGLGATMPLADELAIVSGDVGIKALAKRFLPADKAAAAPGELTVELNKIAAPKEGAPADAKFADEKNQKYPIDTVARVLAAWNHINKAKNAAKYAADALKAVRDRIIGAWKRHVDSRGPTVLVEKSDTSLQAAAVRKGLYAVGRLAEIFEQLRILAESVKFEAEYEGDGSTMPAMLEACLADLGAALVALAEEEIQEALGAGDGDGVALAASAKDLLKALPARKPEDLAKAAMRQAHKDSLQAIHDHASSMGAECDAYDGDEKALLAELQKANKLEHPPAKGRALLGIVKAMTGARDAAVTRLAALAALFKVEGDGDLIAVATKFRADTEALAEGAADLGKRYETLVADHNELLKKAAPGKGVLRLFPVDKSKDGATGAEDTGSDVKPVMGEDGKVDETATSIKKIHATGGVRA